MTAALIPLLFIALFGLPLSCLAQGYDNGLLEIIGKAYDQKTGQFIYTEHHLQMYNDGELVRHHVEYQKPDGSALATKTLDYGNQPFAPAFQLQDWRDGYLEAAEYTDKGYRLKRRDRKSAPASSKLIDPQGELELVSDAGFDRYVQARLPNLMERGLQKFRLAVAGRLASYGFTARLVERTTLFGQQAALIRVELSNLLSLLVDGIDITYALESGHLLRYSGISNIRDDNGVRYDARIDFPPEQRRFNPIGADAEGTPGYPALRNGSGAGFPDTPVDPQTLPSTPD